ncbi:MAG: hypothetical protein R3293_06395 [Candidatus Promineifilaceae bacterium]|nr:hypothetical protein [Candidatus Promineifilaceae bacterium]
MFPGSPMKTISQQVDRLVLFALNWQIPDSFGDNQDASPTIEEVLAETRVNRQKTILYSLTAPGEHPIWLSTSVGEILCHVRVKPAVTSHAPLLLYHHGFAEIPFTATWSRLIPKNEPFPAHSVCIQAPYHNSLLEPFNPGFSSVQHVYQMFAGSLRIMELMQEQFEAEGAAFTMVSGLSWGGITSMLYEGLFQKTAAAIPMFSSPNLAQVLWDAAERYNRTLPVPRETVNDLFDFTPIYERCEQERVFPILGEDDLFFRYDAHAHLFPEEKLVTLPSAHVGAMRRANHQLRRRVLDIMEWAANNPR